MIPKVIQFSMKNASDGLANTSTLTLTCKISKDTGDPTTCTNAAVKKSGTTNQYHVTLTDTERDADSVFFKASATGCLDVEQIFYTVDFPHLVAIGTSDTPYTPVTLENLLTTLRYRIGDKDEGQYPDDNELIAYINKAKTDFEVDTRCINSVAQTTTTTSGIAKYSTGSVFQVTSVKCGNAWLESREQSEMDMSPRWRDDSAGVPKYWMRDNGQNIVLHPIPNSAYEVTLIGCGVSNPFTLLTDVVNSVPVGFEYSIVEGAEMYARRAKPTQSLNAELAAAAEARFRSEVQRCIDVIEQKGRK